MSHGIKYRLINMVSTLISFSVSGDQWANPSGTAMLGQPMIKPEQAPKLHPLLKISLISKKAHGLRIRY